MGLFSSKKNNTSNALLARTPSDLTTALTQGPQLVILQKRELTEVFLGFETVNRYRLFDSNGDPCGSIVERGSGFLSFLKRNFLKSHRPFVVDVFDASGKCILEFNRPFFWIFSDITIKVPNGPVLGTAHRKFGLIHKKYELRTNEGKVFAKIQSSIFKIWTFALRDHSGNEIARISKKWSGMLKEYFTDSDNFMIEFGSHSWSANQRAIILAAAISIDFDYFENNNK